MRLKGFSLSTDITVLLANDQEICTADIERLASALNVEPSDLMIPVYNSEEEVVVKYKNEAEGYFYPNDKKPTYKIHTLARTSKMPLMKGFDIEVLSKTMDMDNAFETSLHSYVYNYGNASVQFDWEWESNLYREKLHPGDSMYMQPFIRHVFSNLYEEDAQLVVIGVSGAINLSTQRELSYFSEGRRVAYESKKWFD